jgi:3-oxoacyl-[acyl-carrier-protein] synthase-1
VQLALIRRHPFYVDSGGVRVRAQYFPDPHTGFDVTRWRQLARAALDELAETLLSDAELPHRHCTLWLVLPRADRPGVPADLAEQVLQAVQDSRWNWNTTHTVRGGHAAGVHALKQASSGIAKSPGSLAVVLAVDTQVHPHTLQWLDSQRLLHGAHQRHADQNTGQSRPNPYGRVPGEGAAAVAITAGTRRNAWAEVQGIATASEAITHDLPKPCLGLGLTQAAQQAVADAQSHGKAADHAHPIANITTDLNGEPYRGDEFGFTTLRLSEVLLPDCKRTTPALASSDLGTASAVTHVALAAYRIRRTPEESADRAKHLILSSSDDTLRGAIVLGPSTPTRNPTRRPT